MRKRDSEAKRNKYRKRLYTVLAVAKKSLFLEEDDYRDILRQFGARRLPNRRGKRTGHYSATTMSVKQIERTLAHFKKRGFHAVGKHKGESPRLGKIKAMLRAQGLTLDYAHGIAKRMYGIERVSWLTDRQMGSVITAIRKRGEKKTGGGGGHDSGHAAIA